MELRFKKSILGWTSSIDGKVVVAHYSLIKRIKDWATTDGASTVICKLTDMDSYWLAKP